MIIGALLLAVALNVVNTMAFDGTTANSAFVLRWLLTVTVLALASRALPERYYALKSLVFILAGLSAGVALSIGIDEVVQEISSPSGVAGNSTTVALAVETQGIGSVTINPGDLTCPTSCEPEFDQGDSVTLAAQPGEGYQFSGWSGCEGSEATCTLTMDTGKIVMAEFVAITGDTVTLVVETQGTGSVTINPGDLTCPTSCEPEFDQGDSVTLAAQPGEGYKFRAWSGDCEGSDAPCRLTMNTGKNVTAEFVK